MAKITAKLDAKTRKISISDGTKTAVLDIGASNKIEIDDGTTVARLDLATGLIEITKGTKSAYLDVNAGSVNLTDGSKEIDLSLADLPSGALMKARLVTVCVDDVEKTAYIAMTEPQ